jgi:hypothetical protein
MTPEEALRAIAKRVGLADDASPKDIAAEVDMMLGQYELEVFRDREEEE